VSQVTTPRRSRGGIGASQPSLRPPAGARGGAPGAATADVVLPSGTPADVRVGTPAGGTGRPRPGAAAVVVVGGMLALGVLVTAALAGGAAAPSVLADPGPFTRWGVLVGRSAYDLAAIGTLGVLLVSVVLLPRNGGLFGPDAARLVRWVSWWAGAWSATAAVTAVLTLSKIAGLPAPSVLAPDVLPLILQLETTRALLASAWLAALVAIGARMTRSPATGLLLLVTAAGALVLPTLTGHARHGDLAGVTATSLALHVVAAAAWVGGLAAVVVHLRRSHATLAVVLPRYSSLALVCYAAVGASGLITGWASLTTLDQAWTTPYGRLLLAKVAALVLLGAFGQRHRSRTLAAVAQRRPRAFVRLAAAELVVMACAASLAVALSSTAPPPAPGHPAAQAAATSTVVAPR
jgi:putative copper export protein